tara:strand:+ start:337 stop:735 length:399 start_codon:yes stop_codon:yes gene_type:complete
MIEAWVGKRLLVLLGACLCCSLQPAQATPPVRGEAVPNECTQAYPFIAGHPPPEDLVDPGTWIVGCNGVMIPTSLVGYYVSLDSWKSVAVAENEHLKSQQPTFWSKWGERAQWMAVGAGVVAVFVTINSSPI